jgi:hypothetical protein
MWSLATKSPILIPPAVYGNGTIYAISSGGEIFAISPLGIELWSISTIHQEETPPIIGPDGTIYVAGDKLAAISESGTFDWSEFCFKESNSALCIPYGTITSMAIDSAGTIYVGTNSSALFALSSQGILLWSYAFPVGGGAISPEAIGDNGTIFVGTNCLSCGGTSGQVFAIGRPAGYSLFSVSESGLPPGTGWSFLVADRNYTTSATSLLFSLPSGNFSWTAPPSEVFERPGLRYSPAVASGSVGVPSTQSLNFVYAVQYELNLTSSPGAGGTVNQSSGWYQSGSTVSVRAVSNSGYQFGSWQTTSSSIFITNSTGFDTTIVVDGPGTASAVFNPFITINVGTGGSLVYNDPPFVGSLQSGRSVSFYAPSISIILLSVVPATGYNFVGWVSVNGSGFDASSQNLEIHVRNPMSLTAEFTPVSSPTTSTSTTPTSPSHPTSTVSTTTSSAEVSVPTHGVLPIQNWGLIFMVGLSIALLLLLGLTAALGLGYLKISTRNPS